MDTITEDVIDQVIGLVNDAFADHGLAIIHTVTITLNGAHGGADVVLRGFSHDVDGAGYHQPVSIELEVH